MFSASYSTLEVTLNFRVYLCDIELSLWGLGLGKKALRRVKEWSSLDKVAALANCVRRRYRFVVLQPIILVLSTFEVPKLQIISITLPQFTA